jgi:cytochrome c556
MRSTLKLALCGATLGLFATGAVFAAVPPNIAEIVKHRQDTMKRQLNDIKAIKDFLDGKSSLAGAQAAAIDLTKSSRLIPTLFPANTGMEQFPKSHAKPIIWQDWKRFLAAQRNLVAKADALAAAAISARTAAAPATRPSARR